MTDIGWPASQGWIKMSKNVNGVEIHYVYKTKTNVFDDFKFK
jgi:filamentous hemagglutinin